jgi:hypothetical protein
MVPGWSASLCRPYAFPATLAPFLTGRNKRYGGRKTLGRPFGRQAASRLLYFPVFHQKILRVLAARRGSLSRSCCKSLERIKIKLNRHGRAWRGHPRLLCLKRRCGWHRNSACPSSALLSAASRVNPTCGDKPGHDAMTVDVTTPRHARASAPRRQAPRPRG